MDDSISHDDRAEAFQIARRGYDRRQVDAYREANESRIDALERHIQRLEASMSELGLARPADLAAELDVVGEEVKRILQEARVAAEQMRSRAADDAARWRAEADEESRSLRESARVVAYETRRSVWENGSEMLASAVAASEAATIAATERALFTQAEAEREASRLVGDARRERDESVGGARDEAERLVAVARQESESIMSAARRQADAAQERAGALELRRAELMAELETARATIAGSEVVAAPDVVPDDLSVEPADAATLAAAVEDRRTHWPDDEGSVKIVSAARVMTTEPVDADAMVAEVEAMRGVASPQPEPDVALGSSSSPSGGGVAEGDGGGRESDQLPAADDQSDSEPEPEPEREPEREPVPSAERRVDAEERSDNAGGLESRQSPVPGPQSGPDSDLGSSSSPSRGGVAEGDGGGQESDQPDSEPEFSSAPPAEGRVDVEERNDDAGGQESDESESGSEPEPEPDPLAGLFAQLREPAAEETSSPPLSSSPSGDGVADGDGGGQESDQLPTAGDQPEPEPESDRSSSSSPPGGGVAEGDGGGQVVPSESAEAQESEPSIDPIALRDRHLLPVQNRALRSIKRRLVEAQNQALENLRLIEGWEPDATIVDGEVSEALTTLARESMVAGFAAAAEMMGTNESPQPADVEPGDPSAEFAGALVAAVQSTVARSRESGAGHRETASSLSRVFRSWRTDEAERRVQFASRAAYHIGVVAALADLGATDLTVASSGRPCRECPANKSPWKITDAIPDGTMMPPARLECACTIVPSR